MSIHEIENKTFADLKAERESLVEAAKSLPVDDLAARYVQARTDAKQRDEKLAEQAKTIEALRDGLAAMKERAEAETTKLAESVKTLDSVESQVDQKDRDYRATCGEFESKAMAAAGQISELTRRCERLKVQAEKYNAAISGVHRLTTDAVNARTLTEAGEGD